MSLRRSGLRLRLLSLVFGAGLLGAALLSVIVLLQVREALFARHIASARRQVRATGDAIARTCGSDGACASRAAQAAGLTWDPVAEACSRSASQPGARLPLCEPVPLGQASVRGETDTSPVGAQMRALVPTILASIALATALLVALVFWLLDRQLVSPLGRIDAALDRVSEDLEGEPQMLAEGGDLIGRLAPAINRLDQRLREERRRVRAQISALEIANEELSKAREGLTRSERLASVGRLAAGVAHEVGNPVAALIGYVEILRTRLTEGRDPADYVERIGREASRIDRILRDLLDLARPPPSKLFPVDLGLSIDRARSLIEAQPVWRDCTMRRQIASDLSPALGDDHYVVQVLVNLLVNAAKAGARTVEVRVWQDGTGPVVEIADDGRGLPAEHGIRLFEPFFTTSGPGQGSGLGLALCHATMERFGGSIAARQREPGPGSVFTLRFRPARPASTDRPAQA